MSNVVIPTKLFLSLLSNGNYRYEINDDTICVYHRFFGGDYKKVKP